jgi:UPF0271 protein
MNGYVLDTSVLYYGKDLPPGYELVISPGVVRELEREGMASRLELLLATRVRVCSPSKRSLSKVESEAGRTGDSTRLSETDKEILALALDLGYQLLTDDYSIQNLATVLGVPYRGFDQKGITRVLEWESKCTGCGKAFGAEVKECDVCGRPTKMRRKRVR